ncbi:hypothetical protein NH340_JMT06925 [Sarcoptes scabiei]|nr:hypothetical protein NH340_JMT06925 [Sarcoptes scabiei]
MFSTVQNESERKTYLLTFLTGWIILSTLLTDPALIPVLMLNILIERMVNFVMSMPNFMSLSRYDSVSRTNKLFYQLGFYLSMAFSSFYQLGNRNSLSTINVNPCFIGLNQYYPSICGLFMIVSIYSTFIFWLTMFFVRLHENLLQSSLILNNEYFSKNRKILIHYLKFCSIINILTAFQFAWMSMKMLVIWILRDHLFIWTIICPKFIYEFSFTILISVFSFLIYVFFTIDNSFMLDRIKPSF